MSVQFSVAVTSC